MGYQLILTTCADMDSAETLAGALLEAKLAACINILPGARSLYVWQGELQRDNEVVLLIKSRQDRLPALRDLIAAQHPYELPELIAVPIEDGSQAYLSWLTQQLDHQTDHQ